MLEFVQLDTTQTLHYAVRLGNSLLSSAFPGLDTESEIIGAECEVR